MANLDPFQRLVALSAGKFADGTSAPLLVRTPDDGDVPLTFFQEMRWQRLRTNPADPYFLDGRAIRLVGPLDQAALDTSLSDLKNRHDVLRFRYRFDVPMAVLQPDTKIALERIELGNVTDEELQKRAVELLFSALDISREPAFRVFLLQLGPQDHLLLLSFHTLALNRPAVEVALKDWIGCYNARVRGEPPPPARARYKFADFARWQRGWLTGAELERRLARCRDRFVGSLPLRLESDRPRPAVQGASRLAHVPIPLPTELARDLVALGRQRATNFSLLLGALAVVLHARTGVNVIALKMVTQALHRATSDMVGTLAAPVVVAIPFGDDPTLDEVIDRANQGVLDALEDQLVPWSSVTGSLFGEPDILIDALPPPARDEGSSWAGLSAHVLHLNNLAQLPGRYDLECFLWLRTESEQFLSFLYNADLFDETTMHALASHHHQVLTAMVESPGRRVSSCTPPRT